MFAPKQRNRSALPANEKLRKSYNLPRVKKWSTSLLVTSLKAPGVQDNQLGKLPVIYEDEIRRKNDEWLRHHNELKLCWDEIQDAFIRQLKYRIDYSAMTPLNIQSEMPAIDYRQILSNPQILEELSIPDLLKQKENVEGQIALEINRLSNYKRDLKNFLSEWETYRVAKIKFEKLSKYRAQQRKENMENELINLEQQYKKAKLYARNFESQKEKKVEVSCKSGAFEFNSEVVLRPKDKVRVFIDKVLSEWGPTASAAAAAASSSFSSSSSTAASSSLMEPCAFILGGPKMYNDSYIGDYNLSLINGIHILFLPKTTGSTATAGAGATAGTAAGAAAAATMTSIFGE